MDNSFSSDRPISNEKDDKFQRYRFAERIAHTIIERDSEDCIVIGIYGAWGEGKTSIINFIETELKAVGSIISIKFNPWRYSDENSLLMQFFYELATSLSTELKTNKEKFGDILKKYGKLLNIDVPIIGGNIGGTIESAGEILSEVDIEALKERIGNILKENKSKVVIFIDDIDRLDKDEIHTVLRMVKLTADFKNTIYILAFDEEMVSAAIGERFGEGNQKAGHNFLEKIVQVPLNIPSVQPEALKHFCFQLVDNAFSSNSINLTEEDAKRFVNEFSNNLLIMLNTPRLAVRYGNTLSFSLPLLYGEVNIVDLMLIEAVKIFYPSHYEFIKENPEYFIGSYHKLFPMVKEDDKADSLKNYLELLGKSLTKKQRNCIQNLLVGLFPRLNEALYNFAPYDGRFITDWSKHKKIVSPKYFNKYFSYSVIKGELSDVAFQNFFSEIQAKPIQEIENSIKTLVEQSSPDNFLFKILSIEEDFNWKITTKIANAISNVSYLFPKQESFAFAFGYDTPKVQAANFIYKLIKNHSNKREQYSLAKELLNKTQSFGFAYELYKWFDSGETTEQKIFVDKQYKELAKLLVRHALKEAGSQPIFVKFPELSGYLFTWWSGYNKDAVTKYINSRLKKNEKYVIDLLRAFTPIAYSTAVIGPYKTDFTYEQYQSFTSIFDKNIINKMISKVYKGRKVKSEPVQWTGTRENTQSDINIVRQFRYWLQKENSIIDATTQPQAE